MVPLEYWIQEYHKDIQRDAELQRLVRLARVQPSRLARWIAALPRVFRRLRHADRPTLTPVRTSPCEQPALTLRRSQ